MRHKSEVQNNQSCTGIVRSSVASVVARATAIRLPTTAKRGAIISRWHSAPSWSPWLGLDPVPKAEDDLQEDELERRSQRSSLSGPAIAGTG